jgi:hypothetical protein
MKSNFRLLLLTLIAFSFSGNFAFAQEKGYKPWFAISVQSPLFYKLRTSIEHKVYVYQLGFETNWQFKNHMNRSLAIDFLYGRYFYKFYGDSFDETEKFVSESIIELDFSMLFGKKIHFLELGMGMDSEGLSKAIIGYRLIIGKHFVFKFMVMPSSYFILDIINDADRFHSFLILVSDLAINLVRDIDSC